MRRMRQGRTHTHKYLFGSWTGCSGYIFGGVAAVIGWRACFFIEAAVGVPVVLFALLAPPVRLRQAEPAAKSGTVPKPFLAALDRCLRKMEAGGKIYGFQFPSCVH